MTNSLNRRDFLKLAGLTALSLSTPPLVRVLNSSKFVQGQDGKPNILIVLFDTLSAENMSIYGYARETMPNLKKWAERAIVYHNHFSGGNFTTPGTASLLTGTYSWKHRAFDYNGKVIQDFTDKSIFHAFKNYHRLAYSHNPLVNTLFNQFTLDIDDYMPRTRLMLTSDGLIQTMFKHDDDASTVAWLRFMKKGEDEYAYSLFLSELYRRYMQNKISSYKSIFPFGPPSTKGDNYFRIEEATQWLEENIDKLPSPFFTYFHLLPPHYSYKPHVDFLESFKNDGMTFLDKSQDTFTDNNSSDFLAARRFLYDEFILYVDRELSRLFDRLDSSGILDNTWVVFTSDHGEMFERGIWSHSTATLYQPVIRIPLIIFEPGRKTRLDIHDATSSTNLLPTLLQLTGQPPVDWTEGVILPPFAPETQKPEQSVYAVQARYVETNTPINQATIMLVKGQYKLVYFFGYKELNGAELVQLYDLKQDPNELNDLSLTKKATANELLAEVKSKLAEVNEPYL